MAKGPGGLGKGKEIRPTWEASLGGTKSLLKPFVCSQVIFFLPNVHYKCFFNLVITGNMSLSGGDGGQRRRPCVGLCYYEKLLALAGKNQADKRPNETIQVSVVQKYVQTFFVFYIIQNVHLADISISRYVRVRS